MTLGSTVDGGAPTSTATTASTFGVPRGINEAAPPPAEGQRLAALDTLVALGNTDIPRRAWAPDGHGVFDGGEVGGDGAMASVAVRFLNRYLPAAMITSHFYVVDTRERPGGNEHDPAPFVVEESCEFLLAAAPIVDGEDIEGLWMDYTYEVVNGARFETEESAQAMRDRCVAAETERAPGERFYWSGKADGSGVHQ